MGIRWKSALGRYLRLEQWVHAFLAVGITQSRQGHFGNEVEGHVWVNNIGWVRGKQTSHPHTSSGSVLYRVDGGLGMQDTVKQWGWTG